MRLTTGVHPWQALLERFPREPWDFEAPVPVRAVLTEETEELVDLSGEVIDSHEYRISFEWLNNQSSKLFTGTRRRFYQNMALGVAADLLAPIFWRALFLYHHENPENLPVKEYVEAYLSRDQSLAAGEIAKLRSGVRSASSVWNATNLHQMTGHIPASLDEPVDPLAEVILWGIGLAYIWDGTGSTKFREDLAVILLAVGYYIYHYILNARAQPDFDPVGVELPINEDPHADPKYLTQSLNWAINIWWKEYLDALAFRG